MTLPDGAKQPIEGNLVYDAVFEKPVTMITGNQSFDPLYWNYVTLPDFGGKGSLAIIEKEGQRMADVTIDQPVTNVFSPTDSKCIPCARRSLPSQL
ncbi:hypothetical protein OVA29_19210 [Exiguobacterium sp. SL14]|nr:hypothetical protein [Exiguobacterium sp. SL14]MCY1692405.1 hypothetical protein [Exiguobacterium sp. SL14]